METYICIPSYARAEILRDKTLTTLKGLSNIIVFVANEEERVKYVSVIPRTMYTQIVVGLPGLVEQRHFIQEWCPVDCNIMMIDDDIEGFESLREINVGDLIKYGFERMASCNCKMWGVSPSANRFFLKDTESLNLKYIIGCFYGIRNVRPIIELAYGDNQEDKERTLRTWVRDGRFMRLNWIAPKTKYYAVGGMLASNPNRKKDTERFTGLLVTEFPQFVKQIAKKDTFDLRFKRVSQPTP